MQLPCQREQLLFWPTILRRRVPKANNANVNRLDLVDLLFLIVLDESYCSRIIWINFLKNKFQKVIRFLVIFLSFFIVNKPSFVIPPLLSLILNQNLIKLASDAKCASTGCQRICLYPQVQHCSPWINSTKKSCLFRTTAFGMTRLFERIFSNQILLFVNN